MMEHKAFLFNYDGFALELLRILEEALASGDCRRVIDFIEANREVLRDPYEGKPLAEDWKSLIETRDAHQYGDFALTKYYQPTDDIGLGYAWQEIQARLSTKRVITVSPILGRIVGSEEDPFDPGKCGSYFQSEGMVATSCDQLRGLLNEASDSLWADAVHMLELAAGARKGLYITF